MPAFIQKESGGFADNAVGHGSQAILEVAERLFAAEPDWIVFFREIMGLDGIVRRIAHYVQFTLFQSHLFCLMFITQKDIS